MSSSVVVYKKIEMNVKVKIAMSRMTNVSTGHDRSV